VVEQAVELSSDISVLPGISTNAGDNSVEKLARETPEINQAGHLKPLP
jgi:hypothetical protein